MRVEAILVKPKFRVNVTQLLNITGGVKKCLWGGANVNSRDSSGNTPLHHAVFNNELSTVKFLLENGAMAFPSNEKNLTPLHIAALQDLPLIAAVLLKSVSKFEQLLRIYETDDDGDTPLHMAGMNDSVKMIGLLLDLGADLTARNKINKTPIDAMKEGCTLLLMSRMASDKKSTPQKGTKLF